MKIRKEAKLTNLQYLRESKGLTQTALSAKTGLNQTVISRLETGPSQREVRLLEAEFGKTLEFLLAPLKIA
jgi:transcriptional regulator with XRE-family HTH domain